MAKGSRKSRVSRLRKRRRKTEKDLKRRAPVRKSFERVLIVCEGGKTEPNYLNALIAHIGLTTAEVTVSGDCGSDPVSVFRHGEKMFEEDSDFEHVLFVFDRDFHDGYKSALDRIEGLSGRRGYSNKNFRAITSVPCFEIWFLFHFKKTTKPYDSGGGKSPCENLIADLKKHPGFERYEKADKTCFKGTFAHLETAKKNAKEVLEEMENDGCTRHEANPSTLMHDLVEVLECVANPDKE